MWDEKDEAFFLGEQWTAEEIAAMQKRQDELASPMSEQPIFNHIATKE